MMNDEPLMNDEQAGEAVARYLEENPELLDGIEPSRDLWSAIEDRITARVLPMDSAPRVRARRRSYGWVPMLIAASALVATSVGITYELTTRASSGATGSVATAPEIASHSPAAPETRDSTQLVSRAVASIGTNTDDSSAPARSIASRSGRVTSRLASRTPEHSANTEDAARSTYNAEIATLRDALDARRSQLNPNTVAIIEQNLRVINEAIRQSREALAKDPHSRLLNDQLDRTLAKKTGLLRAAALLPAA